MRRETTAVVTYHWIQTASHPGLEPITSSVRRASASGRGSAPAVGDKGTTMERRIIGFHQDDEQHWVAELECGHYQHVRHHPPWRNRPWVITAEGRSNAIGRVLSCAKCDAGAPPDRRT